MPIYGCITYPLHKWTIQYIYHHVKDMKFIFFCTFMEITSLAGQFKEANKLLVDRLNKEGAEAVKSGA